MKRQPRMAEGHLVGLEIMPAVGDNGDIATIGGPFEGVE